ncbi:MAG: tRNA pseudouridine(13) synthase TruD [Fuerstiella sp.]|nr:tRNA pseudouridine(13) synthase TruD [Fuerstiella sp.]MCP4509370.1 tRNA pseudouridine(13) synthase TruD [Fuerstiella sp.]
MKLKCVPEDFVVTEVSDRKPAGGVHGLYRLKKASVGTLEALQTLQRSWNLAPTSLNHGGLKDRHAVTSQFVTIRNGPRSDFIHELFSLTYLGQTETAFGAADIVGNQFEIVVRSLSEPDCQRIQSRGPLVQTIGFPNYFDEQRFGSMGASREFIATRWCRKDYEQALWLALAEHNRHDNGAERVQKKILRDLWGEWKQCKQQLDRSHRRSIVTYLVDHPVGFRKAFALLNENLRGLYLSAFQSAVWNRMLAKAICPENQTLVDAHGFSVEVGDCALPFPVPDETTAVRWPELPLPSARCKGLDNDMRNLCNESLSHYEMTLEQMKLSFPRDRWFSRGQRRTVIVPTDLQLTGAVDERYRGRRKVLLSFTLPRGCYATMLIKALTAHRDNQETEIAGESA